MLKVIVTFSITCLLCAFCYALDNGPLSVLWQPFKLLLIVVAVVGVSAVSGTLGSWRAIASDLRRANQAETFVIGQVLDCKDRSTLAPPTEHVIARYRERCWRMLASVRLAETAAQAAGVLAGILGMVHTMGAVTEPPEVLGYLIGGSLVAIVYGMVIAYGLLAPIGARLAKIYEQDLIRLDNSRSNTIDTSTEKGSNRP